jgi:thioredoxin reductase (NADPH)
MKQPNVTVYGSRSCEDTSRALRSLDDQKIAYEFKDVDESPEFNDYIAGLNGGKRVIPTIRVDNQNLVNPDSKTLTKAVRAAASKRK